MISERYVTDETGHRKSQHHGVPAAEWFRCARLAMTRLSQPEWRKANGIVKIEGITNRCDDPDCMRLNRRSADDGPHRALYYLDRNIAPIRPSSETEREIFLCYGHPYQMGKYLCRNCAIVGTTKRLIQEAKDDTVHKRGESTGGTARGDDAQGGLRSQRNDRSAQDADSHHARDC